MIYNVENEDDEEIADDVVHNNDGHNQHTIVDEPATTSAISAPLSAAVFVAAHTSLHDVVEDIEQQQTMVGETIDARAITVSNNATSFFDSFVFLAQDVEVATEASTCTLSLGDFENALQHQEEQQATTSVQVGFESTLQRLPVATLVAADNDDNERQRSLQCRIRTFIMFFLPIVVVAIIAIILSYRSVKR
jgi:hypothetical protein